MPRLPTSIYIGDRRWAELDKGCKTATLYLGAECRCQECPFVACRDYGRDMTKSMGRRGFSSIERWRDRLRARGLVTR